MTIKNHLSIEEIKRYKRQSKSDHISKAWQIILSVASNKDLTARVLSNILVVSKKQIHCIVSSYNKHGAEFVSLKKWGGRREETSHMSLEEEKKILDNLSTQAIDGKVITYRDVMAIVEKKLGKKVSDDYIWDMFKRHGWSKTVPRPHHPKNDKAKMAEFKKNSRKSWRPVSLNFKLLIIR